MLYILAPFLGANISKIIYVRRWKRWKFLILEILAHWKGLYMKMSPFCTMVNYTKLNFWVVSTPEKRDLLWYNIDPDRSKVTIVYGYSIIMTIFIEYWLFVIIRFYWPTVCEFVWNFFKWFVILFDASIDLWSWYHLMFIISFLKHWSNAILVFEI